MNHCRQQYHKVMKPIPHFAGSLQLERKNQRVLIILKAKARRIPESEQRIKAEIPEFIVLRSLTVLEQGHVDA